MLDGVNDTPGQPLLGIEKVGVFGIKLPEWRLIHYATDAASAKLNLNAALLHYLWVFGTQPVLSTLTIIGVGFRFLQRRGLVLFLLSFFVPFLFDLMMSSYTSIQSPMRAFIWFPFLGIMAMSSLLSSMSPKWVVGLLIAVTIGGIGCIDKETRSRILERESIALIQNRYLSSGVESVALLGGYDSHKGTIANALLYRGLKIQWCAYDKIECDNDIKDAHGLSLSKDGKTLVVQLNFKDNLEEWAW
jgi:hypothetical protein